MRTVRRLVAVAAIALICWRFPLFHVAPLKAVAAEKAAATFDVSAFAEAFWTSQLLPSLGNAVKAEQLLPAIRADAADAKKRFARSLGLSDSYYYFLSGTGRVVAISDDAVSLAVTPGTTNTEIAIQTGLVFGDAIRDGTGLLDVNKYPNSQDFNAISSALDHLVETRVLPNLRGKAKPGDTIIFTGCAEVDDESTDLRPLKIIPIQIQLP